MKKLLFVAQFPPPYGGQAIMQEQIYRSLKNKYAGNVKHIPMKFSSSMSEVGGVSFSKIKALLYVISQILLYRIKGFSILYYPPSGPNRVPILRDIVILSISRFFFSEIIFHFHASGLSDFFASNRSKFLKLIGKIVFKAENAIILSNRNAPDDKFVRAKNVCVIPYGIEDPTKGILYEEKTSQLRFLYVGVLKESKGILVLLKAFGKLKLPNCYLDLVGEFDSIEFKKECEHIIQKYGLSDKVIFHGLKTGKKKWLRYASADIFIFPTFFESESFGLVLLEAMSFGMPIITTDWRGVPGVVDTKSSIIVPPRDVESLSDAILSLYHDNNLRKTMGKNSRNKYEKDYTKEIFEKNIKSYFDSILNES